MSLEGDVSRLRLKEPLVRWDRYSPKTGSNLRGGVETYTVFRPRFLSRVVLSQFLLPVIVVQLVSAVSGLLLLSACVLFLRVDAYPCCLAQGCLVKGRHIPITV